MSRVLASVLAVLLLAVVGGPIPAATAGQHSPSGGPSDGVQLRASDRGQTPRGQVPAEAGFADAGQVTGPPGALIDADRVTFRITVFANGSARWTFVYTRSLDNATERRRFEDFAAEFNNGSTDSFRQFKRMARGLVATGRNETGREMQAKAFAKRAHVGGDCIGDDCGTVRMTFVWTEFAREEGNRLVVDDVFEGGLYLGPDQSLVFAHGPGLVFASAQPDTFEQSNPDSLRKSDTLTWKGERSFADRRPRVVYVPEGQTPSSPSPTDSPSGPGTSGTTTGSSPSGDTDRGAPMPMLFVGGVVVVLLGAGLAVVRRQDSGAAASTESDDGDDGVAGEPAVPDEELMSDEDKVLEMLRENGGRMKQVDIVDETGWSKSKVSMLLSDMEDDEEITKLRVGRENIVSLAGHEPDAAGSPHDDG